MHIAISGNIGAGKTTLAKKLADHYGWDILYEAVEGNPYLAPFYGDMKKWSFHLQIYFLNTRFQQSLYIQGRPESAIIQDRSIYEDCFIFAQNLFENKNMDKTDYETYHSLFDTITQTISPPDVMIYLKADLPKLRRQISLRDRDFEQNIDPTYLEQLNNLYESFTKQYNFGLLLEIDVNNLDFVKSESDFKFIVEKLESKINVRPQLKI